MSGQVHGGICNPEAAFIISPTPMLIRNDALVAMHLAMVYGVHAHNMDPSRKDGEYLALSFPNVDLSIDELDKKIGDQVVVHGDCDILKKFIENCPHLHKAVSRRMVQHSEIRKSDPKTQGQAFVRDRTFDQIRAMRKAGASSGELRALQKQVPEHFRLKLAKFAMIVTQVSGQKSCSGRVNSYGFSVKSDPLFV